MGKTRAAELLDEAQALLTAVGSPGSVGWLRMWITTRYTAGPAPAVAAEDLALARELELVPA